VVFKFYTGLLVFPQLRKHLIEYPHLLLLLCVREKKGHFYLSSLFRILEYLILYYLLFIQNLEANLAKTRGTHFGNPCSE